MATNTPQAKPATSSEDLLKMLGGAEIPPADKFKELVTKIDSHQVLSKVFLLEGVPYVFQKSPMKYVIFREQVADRFGIGSQDVCIVGSAKLGYSPAPDKFGTPFEQTSDVDVVLISEPLFYKGSRQLFGVLNDLEPPLHLVRPYLLRENPKQGTPPVVPLKNWSKIKEAVRNFVYENLNPGLFDSNHPLRVEIFSKIRGTAGLFLALEPKVFVSKIRCRVFRNWRAAEDYYANSLREAKNHFLNKKAVEEEIEDTEDLEGKPPPAAAEDQ